jgi:hypothetical protein
VEKKIDPDCFDFSKPKKPSTETVDSKRKHTLFLRAVNKFGLLSKEALTAASNWNLQQSLEYQAKQSK